MAKMGAPTKYKPDFHPDDFIRQSKEGKTFAQIAASWDITRDTLWDWTKRHSYFRDAVKRGREYAEAWYINLGQAAMIGLKPQGHRIDLGWHVWLTKNMFRWNDRATVEHSGPDGKPIETKTSVSNLSDEQIRKRIDDLLAKRSKKSSK